MSTILGIGYGNMRTFAELLAELRRRYVTHVVDVRDNPVSVGRPWLRAAALGEALEREGIGYRHEKSLGNPHRKDRAGGLSAFREYFLSTWDAYDARVAMRNVPTYAPHDARVALLCGCKVEAKCHRSVLLAFAKARGMDVETET